MQVKHFLIICKLILWCLWMKQDELDMVHQEFIYIYIYFFSPFPPWMSHVCMPRLFHLVLPRVTDLLWPQPLKFEQLQEVICIHICYSGNGTAMENIMVHVLDCTVMPDM
jgi:hypothetical protein